MYLIKNLVFLSGGCKLFGVKFQVVLHCKCFLDSKRADGAMCSHQDDLSDEQTAIVSYCVAGLNVFYTGSAGSGKTKTLNVIAASLEEKFSVSSVGRTATTGLAAMQINGQTIHSWAGIGIGRGSRYQLLQNVLANPAATRRWKVCRALIIDEISMLEMGAFDTLEFIGRKIRNSSERFGGIQIILCGDFRQLPPVTDLQSDRMSYDEDNIPFCFRSPKWSSCIDANIKLTKVYRQSDPELLLLLSDIKRGGTLTPTVHNLLQLAKCNSADKNDKEMVYLYPRKVDAQMKNIEILRDIPGKEYVSKSTDTGSMRHKLKSCPYPERLVFKVDAKVMLLRNMPQKKLVNGSLGIISSVVNGCPVVTFENGATLKIEKCTWGAQDDKGFVCASRKQFPLTLAWAMTIHKSQGQTINRLTVSLSGIFAYGQAYVALSRAVSLSGLSVFNGWDTKIPCEPVTVTSFYNKLVPVMEFRQNNNKDTNDCHLASVELSVRETDPQALGVQNDAVPETSEQTVESILRENLNLPQEVEIRAVFEKVAQNECRSPLYFKICEEVIGKLSECHSITLFAAYVWQKLEDIYAPTGSDAECDIKEALSTARHEKKTKEFVKLKLDDKLLNAWLHVLVDASVLGVNDKTLDPCHRTLMVDIINELRLRLAGG